MCTYFSSLVKLHLLIKIPLISCILGVADVYFSKMRLWKHLKQYSTTVWHFIVYEGVFFKLEASIEICLCLTAYLTSRGKVEDLQERLLTGNMLGLDLENSAI